MPTFDIVQLAGFNRPPGNGSLFITWSSNADYTATREELVWRAGDVFGRVLSGTLHVEIAGTFRLTKAAAARRLLESRQVTGKLFLIP